MNGTQFYVSIAYKIQHSKTNTYNYTMSFEIGTAIIALYFLSSKLTLLLYLCHVTNQ